MIGTITAAGTATATTVIFVKLSVCNRIRGRVLLWTLVRASLAVLLAIVSYRATDLLPAWEEPVSRGIVSGLFSLVELSFLTRNSRVFAEQLTGNIDKQIGKACTSEGGFVRIDDVRRLSLAYSAATVVLFYQQSLVARRLSEGDIRERIASLRDFLDDTAPADANIGTILAAIDALDGDVAAEFLLTLRYRSTRRYVGNRIRRACRRPIKLLQPDSALTGRFLYPGTRNRSRRGLDRGSDDAE